MITINVKDDLYKDIENSKVYGSIVVDCDELTFDGGTISQVDLIRIMEADQIAPDLCGLIPSEWNLYAEDSYVGEIELVLEEDISDITNEVKCFFQLILSATI